MPSELATPLKEWLGPEHIETLRKMLRRARRLADVSARIGDLRMVEIYNSEEAVLEHIFEIMETTHAAD